MKTNIMSNKGIITFKELKKD